MRLGRIRFHLVVHFVVLLLFAMVMVNLVLIVFWYHHATHNELQRDQTILALEKEELLLHENTKAGVGGGKISRLPNIKQQLPDLQIITILKRNKSHIQPLPGHPTSFLARQTQKAMLSGKPVLYRTGLLSTVFGARPPFTVIAEPIFQGDMIIGAAGLSHSRKKLFNSLWKAEKATLVYMLVNLFIFGLLHHLRITTLVARPISRLADLADRYSDDASTLFVMDSSGDEFNRLAGSLNNMLLKLEQDKAKLKKTVSELAAANQRLKKQQREIIHAEKLASIGRMAAGLAHEIGNPLGIVQGYLGLLAGSASITSEEKDFIVRAKQELHRMATLVSQLLKYGRMSGGIQEDISVNELLQSTVELLRVQPIFQNISIEYRLRAEQDVVSIDRDQLRQVFINCLQNSCDAILPTKRKGRIIISTANQDQDTDSWLIIRIQDNGTGIPGELINKIFDPFITSKAPGQGTGLGLSVSLSIIEGAGGHMDIANSAAGEGTEMRIKLPLTARQARLSSSAMSRFGRDKDM